MNWPATQQIFRQSATGWVINAYLFPRRFDIGFHLAFSWRSVWLNVEMGIGGFVIQRVRTSSDSSGERS